MQKPHLRYRDPCQGCNILRLGDLRSIQGHGVMPRPGRPRALSRRYITIVGRRQTSNMNCHDHSQ